ncbi:hypothetical protein ACP4OV_001293 [Aristida adscensionis]
MQELRPAPALAHRLFGGGAAAPEAAGEVRCPRCDSANTKFCYYNNYNLAQPRHFCRACRRYWTKGGLLRNVPVGGGCRKPKPRCPSAAAAAAADGAAKNGVVHGAHSDAKNARSGSTAAADASSVGTTTTTTTQQSRRRIDSSSHVTETSACTGLIAGGDTGDTLPPPFPPLPEPMFADQAAAFASFFAPPPPPAFNFSAQLAVAEQRGASVLSKEPSPPSAVAAPETTPFAVRSSGALRAGASDWPAPAADGGIFELTGSIAGDTPLSSYWNPGSWTDPDTTIYQP